MKTKPGRPTREQAQNASGGIVKAACVFFARHGIKGTSNRQIADEAGVTPALVHYYFKDKASLHMAVLESAFVPLLGKLQDVKELQDWVVAFHTHLIAHPWLPHLMIREVLSPDGELRPLFLAHFAPRIFGSLKTLANIELQHSHVRAGLDVDRHAVLLIGMLVYPFLGPEVARNVTGRKFDKRMLEGFRDDALSLFMNGIRSV
ncbi:MAG: TetR/AcrR family transcriptional regulator [Pseudohongiellaceae bacterium]